MSQVDQEEQRSALVGALHAAASGDPEALTDIFERTNGKLFGICMRILRNRELAEDVVQEVYIKIWRKAGRYQEDKASPMTWMATIARNSAIDVLRRKQPAQVGDEVLANLPDPAPLSDQHIEADQLKNRIEDCLGELDAKYRECIRHAYFEGLSYSQVATKVDRPLGTIKGWMRRAFISLRDCLDV
ncbi:sigma-70 family RNA polymerase sigma factor [Sphingomicrobium flavum]|uniref:sigma-70 family RNA polymerase sigma factor n=1 Tax=Sphingomicrobium flavum TaxID=1229164 RepID=UPI0021ADB1A0|nr:sigma-70 family RNA polymerase sigma factor [Sphingomicrobium flavum]